MQKILIGMLFIFAIFPVEAVDQTKRWKGPGWYLMYEGTVYIYWGTYVSEAECKSGVNLAKAKGENLSCDYLKEIPKNLNKY